MDGTMTVIRQLRFATAMLTMLVPWADLASAQSTPANPDPQEAVFQQHCAICHNNPATRAPGAASLRAMSPSFIVNALTSGIMQGQGAGLSPAQKVSIAEYLTGKKLADDAPMAGRCSRAARGFSVGGA